MEEGEKVYGPALGVVAFNIGKWLFGRTLPVGIGPGKKGALLSHGPKITKKKF